MKGGEAAFKVGGLSFRYGARTVLRGVELDIPAAAHTVVMGRNGSGKSTLMRCLAGFVAPDSGRVLAFGQPVDTMKQADRARLIGYLPQFHQPSFPFAVEEVVMTGRAPFILWQPGKRDRRVVEEAMATAGVDHLAGRPYTELSGGERQLVMLARVLAQQPEAVLLDEPAAHLDVANQAALFGLIRRLAEAGKTVVTVLHDPATAFRHGDAFHFLKDGAVCLPDGRDGQLDPGFLARVFGVEMAVIGTGEGPVVVPRTSRRAGAGP